MQSISLHIFFIHNDYWMFWLKLKFFSEIFRTILGLGSQVLGSGVPESQVLGPYFRLYLKKFARKTQEKTLLTEYLRASASVRN